MKPQTDRRDFLKGTALAGVGFWVAGGVSPALSKSPNEKLNFAGIGVGGKGSSDIDQAANYGNVVAICDIDDNTLNAKSNQKEKDGTQRFSKAKLYNDFRKMLEEMGNQIDAVTVSTPDHTHAVAAMMAIKMKKHVYCQKPLTHTVHEARALREAARQYKVCTQMGNQGTAEDGLRRAVEIIQEGVIGPVREVHVWTNRPIWPQGAEGILKVGPAREAALAALHGRPVSNGGKRPTPPKHVHWDLFLGPSPNRPYDPIYHPFAWRGWWDFGTGALGDMACHTANMAFMALRLGSPTSVVAESGEINPETFPMWGRITFDFPARGDMPPLKFIWYEGIRDAKRVLPPDALQAKVLKRGEKLSDSGSMLVGDKGILFSPNDYGSQYKLLPEKDFADYKGPEPTLPRNGKGDDGMKGEWVRAIRENKPDIAMSNFDYAALLTETILLGNVAMRAGKPVQIDKKDKNRLGRKLDWDGENMQVTNAPEAMAFIKPQYRNGWEL
ncbi:MAG TPA: Gfo/Idh/MocA family oxidoreductase [Gemmataceae bacterium]|nr:Gfo/Idh/MocA family oxidoreductase [Gemmataceae bacterium]